MNGYIILPLILLTATALSGWIMEYLKRKTEQGGSLSVKKRQENASAGGR